MSRLIGSTISNGRWNHRFDRLERLSRTRLRLRFQSLSHVAPIGGCAGELCWGCLRSERPSQGGIGSSREGREPRPMPWKPAQSGTNRLLRAGLARPAGLAAEGRSPKLERFDSPAQQPRFRCQGHPPRWEPFWRIFQLDRPPARPRPANSPEVP